MSFMPNEAAGDAILTLHHLNPHDPIPDYRNNPLIGALGPVPTPDERFDAMHRVVKYDESLRALPAHLLPHAIRRLATLFIPQAEHDAAMAEAEIIMRQGYIDRNPLDRKRRCQEARERVLLLDPNYKPPERYALTPLLGQLITGCVGTGKTTVSKMITSRWTQVISHAYLVDGVLVNFTQVVWIRIVLFHDASLKAFAQAFFNALAEALHDPNILNTWKVDRCSSANASILIYRAVLEYRIGAIFVDDSQNVEYHHGGAHVVLNYFVRLMNTVGIPIVLIGTSTTRKLISADETFARRFVCETPEFQPLKPGDKAGAFDVFVEQVFSIQYNKRPTNIQALKPTIAKITGCVPDLIVKLGVLSQSRVFGRENDEINETVLNEVSEKLFSVVADRVDEIKGRVEAREKVDEAQRKLEERAQELVNRFLGERGLSTPFPTAKKDAPIEVISTPVPDTKPTSAAGQPAAEAKAKMDPRAALAALGAIKAC